MKTFENRPLLWGLSWMLFMLAAQLLLSFYVSIPYLSHIIFGGTILIVNFLLYWRSPLFRSDLSGEYVVRFLKLTGLLTLIGTTYFLSLYLLQNSFLIEFRGINPKFKILPDDLTSLLDYIPTVAMICNGYFTAAAIRKHGPAWPIAVSGIQLLLFMTFISFIPTCMMGYFPDGSRILITLFIIFSYNVLPSTLFLLICYKWNMPSYNWAFFLGFGLLTAVFIDIHEYEFFPNHHLFRIPITGKFGSESYIMYAIGTLLQVLLIVIIAYVRPRVQQPALLSADSNLIDD